MTENFNEECTLAQKWRVELRPEGKALFEQLTHSRIDFDNCSIELEQDNQRITQKQLVDKVRQEGILALARKNRIIISESDLLTLADHNYLEGHFEQFFV